MQKKGIFFKKKCSKCDRSAVSTKIHNTNLSLFLRSNCTKTQDLDLNKTYKFTNLSYNLVMEDYNTLFTIFCGTNTGKTTVTLAILALLKAYPVQ